jgi:hypothetical protein
MEALQATVMSHHLFGPIHRVIMNSISIVWRMVHVTGTLCLSYYSGYRRPKDKQGTAGKGKHLTLIVSTETQNN